MDELIGIQVHAEVKVQRGDAETCACGGPLVAVLGTGGWECQDCWKVYA